MFKFFVEWRQGEKEKTEKFFISPKYLSHFNLKVQFQLFHFDEFYGQWDICIHNVIK